MSLNNITRSDWKILLQHVASRKLTLVVGDDLIYVNGKTLNEWMRDKLYIHSLEIIEEYINMEGLLCEDEDIEAYAAKHYNITSDAPLAAFFSRRLTNLYKKTNNDYIQDYIENEISCIQRCDVDTSLFDEILSEVEPKIIISTCYCPAILNSFIEYTLQNGYKPYIGEILRGDSFGGFNIYGREKDNDHQYIWKEGKQWECRKGEMIFLSIGGSLNLRNNSIGNLSVTEDDWIKIICKWIVSIQSQGQTPLLKYLSESYSLVLGTCIPSWAFRFLWYTLNNPLYRNEDNCMSTSLSARPEPYNENVRKFITSYKSYVIPSYETVDFSNLLLSKWKESSEYSRFKDKSIQSPPLKEHIFVSYLSDDRKELEEILIPVLRKIEARSGYTFWYDRRSLKGGDDWDFKIKEAIQQANCFIPFLTKNCKELSFTEDARYLRIEWRTALNKKNELEKNNKGFGVPRFILPVTMGKENVINAHFSAKQSIDVSDENFETKVLSEVEDIINENKMYEKL